MSRGILLPRNLPWHSRETVNENAAALTDSPGHRLYPQRPAERGMGGRISMDRIIERIAEVVAERLALDVMSQRRRFVDVKVAAERLGVSTRWMYDHSDLPFVRRIGRTVRIDLTDLEAWMEGQHAAQGSLLVNELLGTGWSRTVYDGTLLTEGGGTVSIEMSSGVVWSFAEVR